MKWLPWTWNRNGPSPDAFTPIVAAGEAGMRLAPGLDELDLSGNAAASRRPRSPEHERSLSKAPPSVAESSSFSSNTVPIEQNRSRRLGPGAFRLFGTDSTQAQTRTRSSAASLWNREEARTRGSAASPWGSAASPWRSERSEDRGHSFAFNRIHSSKAAQDRSISCVLASQPGVGRSRSTRPPSRTAGRGRATQQPLGPMLWQRPSAQGPMLTPLLTSNRRFCTKPGMTMDELFDIVTTEMRSEASPPEPGNITRPMTEDEGIDTSARPPMASTMLPGMAAPGDRSSFPTESDIWSLAPNVGASFGLEAFRGGADSD